MMMWIREILIKSFVRLNSVDPGFHARRALTFLVRLPYTRYDSSEKVTAFYRAALQKFEAMPRVRSLLFGIFAALALLLAAVGLYGVISYGVIQRTREIGIRIALGAKHRDIISMVLRRGLGLTLVGVVLGTLASLALTRVLSRFLFGISATDTSSFAAMALVLVLVATLACYIPALRASRIDPLRALREE